MNVLVVGGAGYVGSALVPKLLDAGHAVTVVDSFIEGQANALIGCCKSPMFHVVNGDCRDVKLMTTLAQGKDAIYWLAAIVGHLKAGEASLDLTQIRVEDINVRPVERFVRQMDPGGIIIYPNTNAGYLPGGRRTENDLMHGRTAYSITKIEAEKVLMDTGWATSFRLAALYGPAPKMRWDTLLNRMIVDAVQFKSYRIYEPGAVRDVIHVEDACRALMMPLAKAEMTGQIYNVSDHCMAKISLWRIVSDHILGEGTKKTWFEYDKGYDPEHRDFVVNYEKIRELGFRPEIRISTGIEATRKAAMMK